MIPDRVLRQISKQPNGCWIWTGTRSDNGREKGNEPYGKTSIKGKQWRVHRLMYTEHVGPIPEGLVLDHLCKVTLCCNPAHLEAVTILENVRRSDSPIAVNGRKTHCLRGHAFTPDNILKTKRGKKCRTCDRERVSRRYHARVGPPPEGKSRHISPVWGQWGKAKTHCPHGHEYTPENTRIMKSSGGRVCRECELIRGRKRSAERSAAKKLAREKRGFAVG